MPDNIATTKRLFGRAGTQVADTHIQESLHATLLARSLDALRADAATRLVAIFPRHRWSDIMDMTGRDEDWCRHTAALVKILRALRDE